MPEGWKESETSKPSVKAANFSNEDKGCALRDPGFCPSTTTGALVKALPPGSSRRETAGTEVAGTEGGREEWAEPRRWHPGQGLRPQVVCETWVSGWVPHLQRQRKVMSGMCRCLEGEEVMACRCPRGPGCLLPLATLTTADC